MIYGMDWLALARYGRIAKAEHPRGWAVGLFGDPDLFGDPRPALIELLKVAKAPICRVQLMWDDDHVYGDKDLAKLQRLAAWYEDIAKQFPLIKFELSPFCEHNVTNPDRYLRWVKNYAPSCEPVNSVYQGALSVKYKNEVHGTSKMPPKGRYNFSFDGNSCVDSDSSEMKKRHGKAEVFYWWTYQFNLRKNDNDPTPRPDREAVPTPELIDSVVYLKNKRGRVSLPKDWLYKSHADQHAAPVPEPRAFKPVMICPLKVPSLELVADNGQVVAVMPYYGPFADGRHRYYAPAMGYQLAEKAKRIQGSPLVRVVADGKVQGFINPAFRTGGFR
jgi:hypothetical protein